MNLKSLSLIIPCSFNAWNQVPRFREWAQPAFSLAGRDGEIPVHRGGSAVLKFEICDGCATQYVRRSRCAPQ